MNPSNPTDIVLSRYTLNASGCWVWTGTTDRGRVGAVRVNGLRKHPRRVAWELVKGERLSRADAIVTTCNNKLCINPEHHKKMPEPSYRSISQCAGRWEQTNGPN